MESEIMQMKAISIFVDHRAIATGVRLVREPLLINGWINATLSLDGNVMSAIQGAKTVGVAFQYTYTAPFFQGFDGMDFGDGAKKLTGLLRVCHRQLTH
jgi:hypothetical protein